MKYMIHACPKREWYVNGVLIPMMTDQGINRDDIVVWMDDTGKGNLISCMDSFKEVGTWGDGGTWHLQDDVCISRDFKKVTEENEAENLIVCGFMHDRWQMFELKSGKVPAVFMYNSFQCIRIPNKIAAGCAEWFYTDAAFRDSYTEWVQSGKCDDSFFHDYINEEHLNDFVINLEPSIVEHVDWLCGGSVINEYRTHLAKATYWEDDAAIEDVKRRIKEVKEAR